MKNKLSSLFLTAAMSVPFPALADEVFDTYFSSKNPALTKEERAAMAVANKRNTEMGIEPFVAADGAITFVYGAQQPTIVCAVLQVCDVALQVGEFVNSLHLGDKTRWTIEPAITGSVEDEVMHLIIKPLDVGLNTSLVVTTNRRTYHLKLRSHRTQYMSRVAFSYPEESMAKWNNVQKRKSQEREQSTIPATGEYLGNLSFDYDLTGNTTWKPLRVYNDGRKTIIEMPKLMEQTEAPTLLVVRKEGGLFSDDETVMVNYRVHGQRYIVDTVFDKAILIAGVGSNQDRVTITRRK